MASSVVVFAVLTLVPVLALAQEGLHEGKYWRNCETDAQCLIIQGSCDPTAVAFAHKDEAAAYYRQAAQTAKCVERFWKPKSVVARCRLEQCESIPKQAATEQ